ncbi:MAG: hypothetical protein ACRCXT_11175 [Paraclostridium sp.]
MIKITTVNGLITNRRNSDKKRDIEFLIKKGVEFQAVGSKVKLTNDKKQDVVWTYTDNNKW